MGPEHRLGTAPRPGTRPRPRTRLVHRSITSHRMRIPGGYRNRVSDPAATGAGVFRVTRACAMAMRTLERGMERGHRTLSTSVTLPTSVRLLHFSQPDRTHLKSTGTPYGWCAPRRRGRNAGGIPTIVSLAAHAGCLKLSCVPDRPVPMPRRAAAASHAMPLCSLHLTWSLCGWRCSYRIGREDLPTVAEEVILGKLVLGDRSAR